jgi:ubiquinone/menaquinone biosynthesis C-methylase UbiE
MTNTTRDDSQALTARHASESAFHDRKYAHGEGYPRHYAVQPTYPVYVRMRDMMGALSERRVIEYGCGEGWITCDLAAAGARLSAFDISAAAVERTRTRLAEEGLAQGNDVSQMGAERIAYPDATFDVAVGFAILHHLELTSALEELFRVLKPGGSAYFAEPLGTNPLINAYRRLTPGYRTADEAPLDLASLMPMLNRFGEVEHREQYLFAQAALGLAYLPFGAQLFPAVSRGLFRLDNAVLGRLPALGRYAWYTILHIKKRS